MYNVHCTSIVSLNYGIFNEETEGKAAVLYVNDEILLLLTVTYLIEKYRRTCIILNLQYKENPNSDKCIAIFQPEENEKEQ
jgi:hypothetical protein